MSKWLRRSRVREIRAGAGVKRGLDEVCSDMCYASMYKSIHIIKVYALAGILRFLQIHAAGSLSHSLVPCTNKYAHTHIMHLNSTSARFRATARGSNAHKNALKCTHGMPLVYRSHFTTDCNAIAHVSVRRGAAAMGRIMTASVRGGRLQAGSCICKNICIKSSVNKQHHTACTRTRADTNGAGPFQRRICGAPRRSLCAYFRCRAVLGWLASQRRDADARQSARTAQRVVLSCGVVYRFLR